MGPGGFFLTPDGHDPVLLSSYQLLLPTPRLTDGPHAVAKAGST